MTTKIKLKKSSVSSNAPGTGDLDYGELAINYADGRLYYKNSSNVIKNFIDSDLVISTINELSLDSAQTLALFSGGTGVTFNAGEISIGQGVATTDSPTFAGLTVNGDIVVSGGISANSSFGTAGQVLTTDGANAYWSTVSASGGASVEISSTAPSSPTAGDMWFNSNDGTLSVYYDDSDGAPQWVVTSGPEGPQAEAQVTTGKAIAMAIVFG